MTRIRIRIEPRGAGAGWDVSGQVAAGGGWEALGDPADDGRPWRRTLPVRGADSAAYPAPPDSEKVPEGAPHQALCAATTPDPIYAVHERIANRDPQGNDLEAFGRYLFATLLGEQQWARMRARAGDGPLTLELVIRPDDMAINKLPWETMHGPDDFLSKLVPRVTIVRCVAGAAKPESVAVASPPRVLFVIGTDLDDPVIRPGAEYMKLVQSLRASNRERRLVTWPLLRATLAKLEAVIADRKPDIVHFICHGRYDMNGRCYLELMGENDSPESVAVYPEALVEALRSGGVALPRVVVLSACHTADVSLARVGQLATPVAAELVRRGVPVVVGMSGRVSDQACRLFTRRFYEALLEGSDPTVAAAQGRLAALSEGGSDPRISADWTLPAVFVTDDAGWKGLEIADVNDDQWQIAAADYVTGPRPPFCDRFSEFEAFDEVLAERALQNAIHRRHAGLQALAISVDLADDKREETGRFGRTWLLRELAVKAARDGHFPLLVRYEDLVEEAPKDVPGFFDCLRHAVRRTKRLFGIVGASCPAVQTLLGLSNGDSLPETMHPDVLDVSRTYDRDNVALHAAAARVDLMALLEEARASRPEKLRKSTRLVVLVDDVHRFGADAARGFLPGLLGEDGLRCASEDVRCVFTYSAKAVTGQEATKKVIHDWLGEVNWVLGASLQRFRDPTEDRLAYTHCLLHWYLFEKEDAPGGQKERLSLTVAEKHQLTETFFQELEKEIGGIPSRLTREAVRIVNTYLGVSRSIANTPLGPLFFEADDDAQLLQVKNLEGI